MRKMRRPFVDDPKFHRVTVRMTEGEYQELKESAKSHNLIMSQEVKSGIEKYIHYNEKRIKEKLGWISPVEYRLRLLSA